MSSDEGRLILQLQDYQNPAVVHQLRPLGYSVTIDMMQGGGHFEVQLHPNDAKVLTSGEQKAEIWMDGIQRISGVTDEVQEQGSTAKNGLVISGRDMSRWLMDGNAPAGSINNITLAELALKLTDPFREYIPEVIYSYEASRYKMAGGKKVIKKVEIKPGKWAPVPIWQQGRTGTRSEFYRGATTQRVNSWRIQRGQKIWSELQRFCAQIAAHLWMTPDGKLMIGVPDYKQDADLYGRGLVLKRNGEGVALLYSTRRRATSGRHGLYRAHGTGQRVSWKKETSGSRTYNMRIVKPTRFTVEAQDPSPAFWYRSDNAFQERVPRTLDLFATWKDSAKVLRRQARSQMEKAAIDAYTYNVWVKGHRHPDTGAAYAIDSLIPVWDESKEPPEKGLMYIVSIQDSLSEGGNPATQMRLIKPGVWLAFDHDMVSDANYRAIMAETITW